MNASPCELPIMSAATGNRAKVSVVIPVLNEEKVLHSTLSALSLTGNEELIVVDGGSSDRTVSIASQFTDKVYVTQRGRGHQMNFGAERADGDILLFLHADCLLPDGGFAIIRETLANDKVAAGAFDISIDHPGFHFRVIECAANLRSRIASVPYGDQGIFMRKRTFEQLGGFAEIPLMEDIEISGRLKSMGRIAFIRAPIRTSPRRALKEGILYAILRDWIIAISFSFLKVPPERLVKYYGDVR